jgi:hypothetical protein
MWDRERDQHQPKPIPEWSCPVSPVIDWVPDDDDVDNDDEDDPDGDGAGKLAMASGLAQDLLDEARW